MFERRCIHVVFACLIAVATILAVAPTAQPAAAASKSVLPYYFFNPPTDGTSTSSLARSARFVTLSQGQTTFLSQLRAAGFSGTAIAYVLSAELEGPGPYASSSASCNWSYDPMQNSMTDQKGEFCRDVHPHEDWFLHNSNGQRLYATQGSKVYYQMNPGSSGFRNYALNQMRLDVSSTGFNGLMLDNVSLSLYKMAHQEDNSTGAVREYSSDSAYRSSWQGYLSLLSSNLRPAKQLWANMIADPNDGVSWNSYLPNLDGALFEAFATGYSGLSADAWENQLAQAAYALGQGKGTLMISQGSRSDSTRETFGLASYLLVTNTSDAFFRYADYHYYNQWWTYPNYDVTLGAPLGARYQKSDGTWQRDFACGTVNVNPSARTASIRQSTCDSSPAPSQSTSSSVRLSGVSDGQSVSGSITVQAIVDSSSSVDRVRFYIDGNQIGSEGVAPYYLGGDNSGRPYGYDISDWSNGSHVLKATATLNDGSSASTQLTLNVGGSSSSSSSALTLSGVSNGQTVSGRITVQATTNGSDPIDRVVFYVDGDQIDTEGVAPYYLGGDSNGNPYGYDISRWSSGSHVLKAVATFNSGATASTQLTLNVAASSGVTLSGISNGQTVSGRIKVLATVNASNVNRVRFYLDGTQVWSESIAPYYLGGDSNGSPTGIDTHIWNNGTYTLKVVATLSNGSTLSTQLSFTIRN